MGCRNKKKMKIGIIAVKSLVIGFALMSIPVKTYAMSDVVQISSGSNHTLALNSDGTVWSWGSNYRGQLGLGCSGDNADKNEPVKIPGFDDVSQIFAGSRSSFAIKNDGTVWSWGNSWKGDLGLGFGGIGTVVNVPTQIPGLNNVRQIVNGGGDNSFTLALKGDGTVWSWGDNRYGQLGLEYGGGEVIIPTQIPNIENAVQVAIGEGTAFVLKSDGTVWACGNGQYGLLGYETIGNMNKLAKVSGLSNVSQVVADYKTVLALKDDGTVWSWGRDWTGSLGLGDVTDVISPTKIESFDNVSHVYTLGSSSYAIKADGTIWAWGNNSSGQLGLGDNTSKNTPTKINGFEDISQFEAGGSFVVAVKKDGSVWTWGYNISGELGLGDNTNRNIPTRMKSDAEKAVEKAEASRDFTDIDIARELVNKLAESLDKDQLSDRLNNIFPNMTVEKKTATAGADIYIKSKNTLSLSLDTNLITFEEVSGVEDIEKQNAVTLTVESSLPYEVNSYLESEIQNADKTVTVDKSILNIKSNNEAIYKSFLNIGTAVQLLDNQTAGTVNSHEVDLKLNKDVITKADNYKTAIKFEVKQK